MDKQNIIVSVLKYLSHSSRIKESLNVNHTFENQQNDSKFGILTAPKTIMALKTEDWMENTLKAILFHDNSRLFRKRYVDIRLTLPWHRRYFVFFLCSSFKWWCQGFCCVVLLDHAYRLAIVSSCCAAVHSEEQIKLAAKWNYRISLCSYVDNCLVIKIAEGTVIISVWQCQK